MEFIQNSVINQKYVAQIVIKKTLYDNESYSANKFPFLAAIRQFICGTININGLPVKTSEIPLETKETLRDMKKQYQRLSANKNVGVYLTTSGAGRGKLLINICLIESKKN